MEEGRIDDAEAEKNRLENQQRERRKRNEEMGIEQQALWFRYREIPTKYSVQPRLLCWLSPFKGHLCYPIMYQIPL
jgi:hypothetical protein